MRNRGQLILGGVLVIWGVLSLLSTLLHIDLWGLCFPLGLIALGVWFVLRPRIAGPDKGVEVSLLGEIRRQGDWAVRNEEFWQGIGDIELDLTRASIPTGETLFHIYTFVSDVDVFIPRSAGALVHVSSVVGDANLFDAHQDIFFSTVERMSENYTTAECRVRIEVISFVGDVKVRQI